ncbi:MAG: L-threonylcarbamoyladenylate synthase [Nitrospirae bacterium YQR-1]
MPEVLDEAAQALSEGRLIAYPTETFYALGVACDNKEALRRLFELKGRPENKPFPLIAGSVETIERKVAVVDKPALALGRTHWPGALTILLKAKDGHCSEFILNEAGKVAVRIPGESFALALARRLNYPITSTSANPSGLVPAADAATVVKYFGTEAIDIVIDGGCTPGGLPSTILEVTADGRIKILRAGAIQVIP